MENIGSAVWPKLFAAVMIGDLVVPCLLAPFYRGYSHRTMVMSALGNPKSPVRFLYGAWLVLAGLAFLPCSWIFSRTLAPVSPALSAAVLVLLFLFGVGAMVLSGLFPVGESKRMDTLSAKIHGYGSSIGFVALLPVPLLLAVLSGRRGERLAAMVSAVCFVLALVAFCLFILADKEAFRGTAVDREGRWQRLTLLFLYLPILFLCLR